MIRKPKLKAPRPPRPLNTPPAPRPPRPPRGQRRPAASHAGERSPRRVPPEGGGGGWAVGPVVFVGALFGLFGVGCFCFDAFWFVFVVCFLFRLFFLGVRLF